MSGVRRLGADAEDRAARFLLEQGYTIVTRRWKGTHGELDIVALDGEVLVLVEVKARRAGSEYALASLEPRKVQRWKSAAEQYAAEFAPDRELRFDAILVTPGGIEHLQNVL